jgi:hypothetical protein
MMNKTTAFVVVFLFLRIYVNKAKRLTFFNNISKMLTVNGFIFAISQNN